MSDIITEFGAGSLATHLAAEVGALPQNMSAMEGASNAPTWSLDSNFPSIVGQTHNGYKFSTTRPATVVNGPITLTPSGSVSGFDTRVENQTTGTGLVTTPIVVNDGDVLRMSVRSSGSLSTTTTGYLDGLGYAASFSVTSRSYY
tara:strand:- start:1048 stop:1482 length:435 start_codon:yes stop_codon:yes gene_type:complete